ncbi:cuticle protein 7-like [Procambarus clarkii]|uniref:cuticle protein 7-like n=1 Tax=Procambarus clarkii TaxID=6728 RepID=UPI0037446789
MAPGRWSEPGRGKVYKQVTEQQQQQSVLSPCSQHILWLVMLAKVSLVLSLTAVVMGVAVGVAVGGGVGVAVGGAGRQPALSRHPRHVAASPNPSHTQEGGGYNFQYGVTDDFAGAHFGQDETSDGHLIKGSYYVVLPDGRLQTVTYQADHTMGFVADVEFDGEALHPVSPSSDPRPFTIKPSTRPLQGSLHLLPLPEHPPAHY